MQRLDDMKVDRNGGDREISENFLKSLTASINQTGGDTAPKVRKKYRKREPKQYTSRKGPTRFMDAKKDTGNPQKVPSNNKKPIGYGRATKPVYSSDCCLSAGPYYDPLDIHICRYTNGVVKYLENPKKPFYSRKLWNKTLRYCVICYKPDFRKSKNKEAEKTFLEPMEEFKPFGAIIKQSTPVLNRWEKLFSGVLQKIIFQPLIDESVSTVVEGEECVYDDNKRGRIVKVIDEETVLIEDLNTFKAVTRNTFKVFCDFDRFKNRKQLSDVFPSSHKYFGDQGCPIRTIPSCSSREKLGYYQDLWKTYKKWDALQRELDEVLPEECQYFQTFTPYDLSRTTGVCANPKMKVKPFRTFRRRKEPPLKCNFFIKKPKNPFHLEYFKVVERTIVF